MAVGANIPDLAALYDQLKNSMQEADTMINQLDGRLTQANEEWRSKGAHEFNDAWHNGFKPSLTKMCQALATAGTDVAFQHTDGGGCQGSRPAPAPHAAAVPPLTRSIAQGEGEGPVRGPPLCHARLMSGRGLRNLAGTRRRRCSSTRHSQCIGDTGSACLSTRGPGTGHPPSVPGRARIGDRAPAQSGGPQVVHGRDEIALEVGPLVGGPLVSQPAVELDEGAELWIVNVAKARPVALVEANLTLAAWEPMGLFDASEVAVLEQREGAGRHVLQDSSEERPAG